MLGRRQYMKLRAAILASSVNPVNDEGVEMNICIKGISVTLNKCNGATLRRAHAELFRSAPPQFAKQGADKNVQHIAGEARVVGYAVAQRKGQRQYPLPYRD